MKKNLSNGLIVLIFIIGISLLLYPGIADLWNSYHQSYMIASYEEKVEELDTNQELLMINDAKDYNQSLLKKNYQWTLTDKEMDKYNNILDITGTGIMGYVEIPKINVELPIYHNNDEASLQVGIGHFPGSSFPVGGFSTHCVLTGHTGLPSSRLLTDIDQLEIGDVFYLHVLDDTLAYEVDQVKIVLPEETEDIEIIDGADYCTLVTCTPYGVNSHRLLVRAKRVSYVDINSQLINEVQVFPIIIAIFIVVLLYVAVSLVKNKFRKKG